MTFAAWVTETHPEPVSQSVISGGRQIRGCGCSRGPKQQWENKLWFHTGLRWHGSGTNSWSLLGERSCRFQWNHLDHQPLALGLRVVDLLEHQLTRDGCLCTMYCGRTTLKCWNHLLHHLVKEDVSELRVEEGTKLEGDLTGEKGEVQKLAVHSVCLHAFSPHSQKHEATGQTLQDIFEGCSKKCHAKAFFSMFSPLTLHATYAGLNLFRRKTEFEIKKKTDIISAGISEVSDICRLLTEKSTVQVRG